MAGETPPPPGNPGLGLLRGVAFANGGVILALEILASRILSPVFGSSLAVWSSLIAVVLGGLSLGYMWGGRRADGPMPRRALGAALAYGGLLTLAIIPLRGVLPALLFTAGARAGPLLASLLLLFAPGLLLGMVLPLSTRMATPGLERMGRSVGELYALATLGSILGALATGFLLIPLLDVTLLLALLGAIPLALSLPFRGLRVAPLALAGIVLLLASPRDPLAAETLWERNSEYAHLRVLERNGSRYLLMDSILQGGLDAGGRASTRYLERFPEAAALAPRHERALILGLGTGGGAWVLHRVAPRVEVVEVDPQVARVSRDHFLSRVGWEPAIHLEDARVFLATTPQRYDVIVVDTYTGSSIPPHLATREFVRLLKSRLEPGGLAIINLLGSPGGERSRLWRAVAATYASEFPRLGVNILHPQDTVSNVLLLATEGDTEFPRGYRETRDFEGAPVLTDERAPVEWLATPVVEEMYRVTVAWLHSPWNA
ncbi:MAG: fused MFS/spermidine synthase [Euryarchaeota archaeon]|nr:fused MFS/spermidine synthase [Euryarchaeota archaeon]